MKAATRVLFVLFLILVGAIASSAAETRSGTIIMEFDLSHYPQASEARLWIPYPVSDAHQRIGDIRVEGDFASSGVYTERTYGTPILYADWPQGAENRKLVFSFSVDRRERDEGNLPDSEASWAAADYALFLGPSRLGPTDGEVKKLADRITANRQGVLARSRAIYDWVCDNMVRNPKVVGCGEGDVCLLLETRSGKCTDISSVYVALARAAGIPAREVFGLRLGRKAEQNVTGWQHCWAEFFLPGHGWVPVDPGDVRKMMLEENLKPEDPRAVAYREYFWGGIDAYRIKLAVGRDLKLNPSQAGAPLNTFGYPYAEVDGKPLDWLDPETFSYRIKFRETGGGNK